MSAIPHTRSSLAGQTRSRGGFSLLELLVAVAVLIGVLGALFIFLWNIMATRNDLLDRSHRGEMVQMLFEGIERDLTTALASDWSSSGGAGVAGTIDELSIAHDGVALFAVAQGRGLASGLKTGYRFAAESGEVTVRRERGNAPGAAEALGHAAAIRFRYLAGGTWSSEWNSRDRAALPDAVEISVWFGELNPSAMDGPPDRQRVFALLEPGEPEPGEPEPGPPAESAS